MAKHLCWILFVLSFTGTLSAGVIEAPSRLEHFQCYLALFSKVQPLQRM